MHEDCLLLPAAAELTVVSLYNIMTWESYDSSAEDHGTPSTVTFGPTSNSMLCVEIPIDDDLTESCDERFSYEFTTTEARAIIPSQQVTIQIVDDDGKL